MRPQATSVCGLKLLVYDALSVQVQLCKRHYEEWLSKYFFSAPPLLLSKEQNLETGEKIRHREPDVCFRKLILGTCLLP